MSGTLSVLICTYNRPRMLARCLAALIECIDEKPDQVVVVNGGDERADAVVKSFAEGKREASASSPSTPMLRLRSAVEIILVKTVNKNLAASRNVGLPHCTGDIVAMTDDDAEVFPDWVGQMKRMHREHPEAGAIGGPVFAADTGSLVSRIADRVTFARYPAPRYVRTLPGVNVSYKREVIERVGLQDETLFRGEDVDYNWRVKRLGYEIYYDPAIRVLHHHRPTLRGFLNQHYMYGRAYYLVRRKWQEMYCIYPHGLRRPKDFLKAVNFFAGVLYEPFLYAPRLERPLDKVLAIPVLIANGLAWRGGMVRERLAS